MTLVGLTGKSVRRRAASMETSKFEKRRGRAKKRVEALRNAQALGLTSECLLGLDDDEKKLKFMKRNRYKCHE